MVSAVEHIAAGRGAYLLGRKRPHPDRQEGDYRLERAMETGVANPVDLALDAVLNSHAAASVKAYLKLVNSQLDKVAPGPTPTPIPTPTPVPIPSAAVLWTKDSDPTLDQADTGHCTGFGSSQYRNTNPVNDDVGNDEGHATYYRLKVIDGEPKAEDGSSVHSVATDLVNRGRIKTYAWTTSAATMSQWVLLHGSLIIGIDWYDGMFTPSASGLIAPTGALAGGHCLVVAGYDPSSHMFALLNSWGSAWGNAGYCYITDTNLQKLMSASGAECMAAIELPLAA